MLSKFCSAQCRLSLSVKSVLEFKPSLRWDQWFSFSLLIVALFLIFGLDLAKTDQDQLITVPQLPIAPIPVRLAWDESQPQITAESALVIDLDSASILYAKNPDKVYLPASTTKLMTAVVARQLYDLDQVLTVPPLLFTGSVLGLGWGEQFRVYDLLQASLIQSSNDAALTLAAGHDEGVIGFVRQMNKTAQDLGMSQTIFENPTGFDGVYHQTTVRDLSLLTKHFMTDPVLAKVVGTAETTIADVSESRRYLVVNTHQLLLEDPSVIGVKTGTTEGARQVLITQVETSDHLLQAPANLLQAQGAAQLASLLTTRRLLVVVLASQDRYADTQALVNWSLSAYEWRTPEINFD